MAMVENRLYDSKICRLCAENNDNGEKLFTDDSEETELSAMINRYLPLKVHNDGKLPQTICPGCNIQLEATVQFFELLINGQQKIREMWKKQVEQDRKIEREHFKLKNVQMSFDSSELLDSQDECTLLTGSEGQQIFVNVMPDGSVYATEHDLSLQMEGLDKPKRKRGRPPKTWLDEEAKVIEKNENNDVMSQEEEDEHDEADGRRRRKRQVPRRYMETVQGKELDKIFKEQGVLDEDEIQIKCEPEENLNNSNIDDSNSDTEIIGHLETLGGENLGELIRINKNRSKSKSHKSIKKKFKFTCPYCGKGFMQRSKYIIHKSYHKTLKFECVECDMQFSNEQDMINHQKTENHTDMKVFEMENSIENYNSELLNISEPSTTDTSINLPETNNAEHDESENDIANQEINGESDSQLQNNSFKCDKCNKHFQSKEKLKTHIKVGHEGEKPFVCEICNKAFAYETSLSGHKTMSHPNNKPEKGYPCDICGKVFSHPSSITYHKSTEHNDSRRFVCGKCGKGFKHKQLLQRHQLVHSENRPYPCNACDASFKTKANLMNHQSTHTGEKKHECELCGNKFAHKTSLTLHYRTHSKLKPYKCDVCAKSFSQNGNLQEHMRIHTGEKPYCCDHCGRKFTTSSQFKLHVKRHTGERPWKCDHCPKSFLHKDTWKCHVRRHTGERPFQCCYCNRGFTEQWALKKHLRLHTGEKPYSCDVCGKAFADCSNLTKHKKVHKKQTPDSQDAENSTVLQILSHSNEDRLMTPHETSEEGTSQIFYVYQDADHSSESITFEEQNLSKENNLNMSEEVEEVSVDLQEESDVQLEITDEDGNCIPMSIQEARQLFAEGQLVSQLQGEQTIRVASLSGMDSNIVISSEKRFDSRSAALTIQTDAEEIVKDLEDEDTDATTVAAINQLNAEERLELEDGQQTLEFITQDGQKVRFYTSMHPNTLNIDPSQLTIVTTP